jgi:hypothetical protein
METDMRWRRKGSAAVLLALVATSFTVGSPASAGPSPVTMQLEPTSGAVGSTVAFSGTNCTDVGKPFSIYFAELPQTLSPGVDLEAQVPIQPDGRFAGSFVVPERLSGTNANPDGAPVVPGTYDVIGDCGVAYSSFPGDSVRVQFTVTDGSGPVTPPPAGPFTPPATPPAGDGPLSVSAGQVPPGGAVTVTGGGFVAGEAVPVVLYSSPVILGTAVADQYGSISAQVTIPAGTAAGIHTLVAFGSARSLVRQITVATPAPGPAPAPVRAAPSFTG